MERSDQAEYWPEGGCFQMEGPKRGPLPGSDTWAEAWLSEGMSCIDKWGKNILELGPASAEALMGNQCEREQGAQW